MSKAKRRIPISRIIAALILCLILAGAVYAAIMRSTKTDNIITFGSIKMRLIETTTKDGSETDQRALEGIYNRQHHRVDNQLPRTEA